MAIAHIGSYSTLSALGNSFGWQENGLKKTKTPKMTKNDDQSHKGTAVN